VIPVVVIVLVMAADIKFLAEKIRGRNLGSEIKDFFICETIPAIDFDAVNGSVVDKRTQFDTEFV